MFIIHSHYYFEGLNKVIKNNYDFNNIYLVDVFSLDVSYERKSYRVIKCRNFQWCNCETFHSILIHFRYVWIVNIFCSATQKVMLQVYSIYFDHESHLSAPAFSSNICQIKPHIVPYMSTCCEIWHEQKILNEIGDLFILLQEMNVWSRLYD